MIRFFTMTLMTLALALLAIGGCDRSPSGSAKPAGKPAELPAGLMLAAAPGPGAPTPIGTLKGSLKEGAEVIVRGVVGGQRDPFIDGRAMLMLVDVSVPNQCAIGDDHCNTPWDYCCAPSEEIGKSSAMVRVTGPDGAPLKGTLKGASGIGTLSILTIKAKVAAGSTAEALTLDAVGIYLEPAAAKPAAPKAAPPAPMPTPDAPKFQQPDASKGK